MGTTRTLLRCMKDTLLPLAALGILVVGLILLTARQPDSGRGI